MTWESVGKVLIIYLGGDGSQHLTPLALFNRWEKDEQKFFFKSTGFGWDFSIFLRCTMQIVVKRIQVHFHHWPKSVGWLYTMNLRQRVFSQAGAMVSYQGLLIVCIVDTCNLFIALFFRYLVLEAESNTNVVIIFYLEMWLITCGW